MKKVLLVIGLLSLLFACEKKDNEVAKIVELNNQWSVDKDVKSIDACLLSVEEKYESGLYRSKWKVFTGAETNNNRIQLNTNGSSLSFNLFHEKLTEGKYSYLAEGEEMTNQCFTASYQLDYLLQTPVSANEILIVAGTLIVKKQGDIYTLSFDLTDASGKRIRGEYTGKPVEQFNIELENQWRVANEVMNIDANVLYFQESPADKILRANLNLYTGATFDNGRLQFETQGSSIAFSVNFTEDIAGVYAFEGGTTSTETGKFQAFYGKNYALQTPIQDDFIAIQSGSLSIVKEGENYNVHFELVDTNDEIITGTYSNVLMPLYGEYVDLLSGNEWSAKAFYIDGIQQPTISCMADDVMRFNADGTYTTEVNGSCDESDPDEDEIGTYRIENGNLIITPSGDNSQILRIVSITASKLIISATVQKEDNKETTYEYVME